MKNKFNVKNKYAWWSWRDGIFSCDFSKVEMNIVLSWETPASNVIVAVGSIGNFPMVWQKWQNMN